MYIPKATYRIQFNKGFTLQHLKDIIPYLAATHIDTIYASPIFTAVPGSMHGYDIADPHTVNPEIGTLEEWREVSSLLKQKGIGWIQDIVPNHMAYHSCNKWLMDIFRNGWSSRYASFFDIYRGHPEIKDKVLAPFLSAPIEQHIAQKEISLAYESHWLEVHFPGGAFPLHKETCNAILKDIDLSGEHFEEQVNQILGVINDDAHKLADLLSRQCFQLCEWQCTDQLINYRRFFTVNQLICLDMSRREVFDEYHRFIVDCINEGLIQGVRIDHIDGLADPATYLNDLRNLVGPEIYITVEKILEESEKLPDGWPVQGTTGYEFMAAVNRLSANQESAVLFDEHYRLRTGGEGGITLLHEKKRMMLFQYMQGELNNLVVLFRDIPAVAGCDIDKEHIKSAIGEWLVDCPVYRYYSNRYPLSAEDSVAIRKSLSKVKSSFPELDDAVSLLEEVLCPDEEMPVADAVTVLKFFTRSMQLSGPLMAKGLEDTFMYGFARFVGHNEVGNNPLSFGWSATQFNNFLENRARRWPLTLNATATHDTKRGEDSRARLSVLTDCAAVWFREVSDWSEMNKVHKTKAAPDTIDEYFLYQVLAGSYPGTDAGDTDFKERLQQYMQKALREAKRHSSWDNPDAAYEDAMKQFIDKLLASDNPFCRRLNEFTNRIADAGFIQSLNQLVLKCTCPGIPDFYQGTELWDFSFVDPDNRRQVDYQLRSRNLDSFKQKKSLPSGLWNSRKDGRIKQWLMCRLLEERSKNVHVFEEGMFIPLPSSGIFAAHIHAFARRFADDWYVSVMVRSIQSITDGSLLTIDWGDTSIRLPDELLCDGLNVITGKEVRNTGALLIGELFESIPIAVLQFHGRERSRGAGILMSLTSLPGDFGVGDVGPAARQFADLLSQSGQRYWQLLPINPVSKADGFSPYSSISSMAGNGLLLSPELAMEDGLLPPGYLDAYSISSKEQADYLRAEMIKDEIFNEAFRRFKRMPYSHYHYDFKLFSEEQKSWLDDFARFCVLKSRFEGMKWVEWPEHFRDRDSQALLALDDQEREFIERIKWLQFLFQRQWQSLRKWCNERGVRIIGDLPFYVSYDSTDVWANRHIFCLDSAGKMKGVAGVPPDYFSKTGQLWGVPTYNWDALRKEDYACWINRLRRNVELFDLVRIDHFRALSCYWEVPAGAATAEKGEWRKGPEMDFFRKIKRALGSLPFIAEDLGDHLEDAYALRDRAKLPGMKVLQFAFGEHLPFAVDIPHNYPHNCIAYTGTHDNNTVLGWFRQEAKADDIERLSRYAGVPVTEGNVVQVMIKMVYASVADTAIIPLQDILALDENSRMNLPSSANGNWKWRATSAMLDSIARGNLRELTRFYGRT